MSLYTERDWYKLVQIGISSDGKYVGLVLIHTSQLKLKLITVCQDQFNLSKYVLSFSLSDLLCTIMNIWVCHY